MIMVCESTVRHPLALRQPLPRNAPISTILTMGEWLYLCTHACYRQKWGTKKSTRRWSFRRYVIQPSNSTMGTIRTQDGTRTGLGYFPLGLGEIDYLGKCSKKVMIPSDLKLQYFHAAPSASSSTAYTTMDSEGSDNDE